MKDTLNGWVLLPEQYDDGGVSGGMLLYGRENFKFNRADTLFEWRQLCSV